MAEKGQAPVKPIMTEAGIKAKTGKGWDYWFKVLDKAGAAKLDHKGITAILNQKMNVGPWWGQMIAVSYERARGIRAANQKCDGEFSVSVSRVMDTGLSRLFAAATADHAKWFPRGTFVPSSSTKDKYWRGQWKKGGRLEINFYAKGAGKAQIVVQSNKLSGTDAVEVERAAWKKALDKLQKILPS